MLPTYLGEGESVKITFLAQSYWKFTRNSCKIKIDFEEIDILKRTKEQGIPELLI